MARLSYRKGVRGAVRPFVALCSSIEPVQANITKSLLWAASKTLVYCDKISCSWVKRLFNFTVIYLAWKRLQIGINVLLIITSTASQLYGYTNVDDLERPEPLKQRVLGMFFAIFDCGAYCKSKLRRNGWWQTRTHEISSVKRRLQTNFWPPRFNKLFVRGCLIWIPVWNARFHNIARTLACLW